jgi:hypothetical protein
MRRLAFLPVVVASVAVLAGCGGANAEKPASGADQSRVSHAGPQHVHGLGINPADGDLFIATHNGLWQAPTGRSKAERVGDVTADLMGFTVVGPDSFLASGHPSPQSDSPPQLGLQRSIDGGQSWQTVSLLGEADLHVLRAAERRIYGVDSGTGAFLTSSDAGESWEKRTPPAPVLDLAIHPDDSNRLIAATERGLFSSTDTGQTWRALRDDVTGLLAWPAEDTLYLADGSGQVARSANGGRTFKPAGSAASRPEAFAANARHELYAAVNGGQVLMSTDGGTSWRTRSTP